MHTLLLGALALAGTASAERYAADDTSGKLTYDMVASLHDIHGQAGAFTSELDVGRGGALTGKVQLQTSALTTFLSVRDSRMHEYCLDTERYPTIDFHIAAIDGDTAGLKSKQGQGSVVLKGQLKIRSASRDVSVPATYAWTDGTLHLSGAHTIAWPDYGVPDPSIVISTLYPDVNISFDLDMRPSP